MNHRRLLCLVAVLALGFSGAHAGPITLGAKMGLVLSNGANMPEEWFDPSFKTGFTAGVFMNFAVTENFSLQPELLYTQKGATTNLFDDLLEATAKFDYVELPLLARYTIPVKGNLKPFVYAGPGIAFNTSSELEVGISIFSTSFDISSITHTTDFIVLAGGGFDLGLGAGKLLIDARFQYGFTNVIQTGDFEINGSTETITADDFKNYAFIFMAGYGFGF
ncbi:MAG: PorT family protein [Chitinivibrionia bacterium]|nr:PorT family protein [Chitinivibrionia bacterium]